MDDVSILPRDALDNEHRANLTKPWLTHFPDGTVEQFDTEGEACEAQLGWREAHNPDDSPAGLLTVRHPAPANHDL